jgi:DNA invertase Pin-like site-specific DNA recombinase
VDASQQPLSASSYGGSFGEREILVFRSLDNRYSQRNCAVAFVSLRDNLDLSTPSGRLMFQIIGAMAEFERYSFRSELGPGCATRYSKGRRWAARVG